MSSSILSLISSILSLSSSSIGIFFLSIAVEVDRESIFVDCCGGQTNTRKLISISIVFLFGFDSRIKITYLGLQLYDDVCLVQLGK